MACQSGVHCRCFSVRRMGLDEVEMKNHQVNGVHEVFKLLGITERETGKTAIEKTHGKVLPLHVAGGNQIRVWIAVADMDSKAGANRRRIASFGVVQIPWIGVLLHLLGEINTFAQRAPHFDLVRLIAVCGELKAALDTLLQVRKQSGRVADCALADDVGNNQLGLGIHRHEKILRAFERVMREIGAVFASDKAKHLIGLD